MKYSESRQKTDPENVFNMIENEKKKFYIFFQFFLLVLIHF